ncbi:MAG: hypothetical protein ACRDR6_19820 [Pseudonocardiaceae bacterium]
MGLLNYEVIDLIGACLLLLLGQQQPLGGGPMWTYRPMSSVGSAGLYRRAAGGYLSCWRRGVEYHQSGETKPVSIG